MTTLHWVVAFLLLAAPLGVHIALLRQSVTLRPLMLPMLGTMAAAAVLVVPAVLFLRMMERWAEIDPLGGTGGSVTLLLYAFLVVAPLEQGLAVGAMAPFWRLRRLRMRAGLSRKLETIEGVTFAACAGLGFATARSALYLVLDGTGWLSLGRAALAIPVFVLLCSWWGYALGRHAPRGLSGRRFSLAWLGATTFLGVFNQMVFQRGVGSLLATVLLLGCMLVGAWVLWRDVRGTEEQSSGGRLSLLFATPPAPSLATIRDAFRRHDQPISVRWIALGALVTTGVIVAGLSVAVMLGHRLGLDFSAVDRPAAGAEATAPLALLGVGALAAFPVSGYLLARASAARTVLQPAIGASLAMVLVLVFMGMLAPLSVVFAIAFAPVAFALSCFGAWLGMGS